MPTNPIYPVISDLLPLERIPLTVDLGDIPQKEGAWPNPVKGVLHLDYVIQENSNTKFYIVPLNSVGGQVHILAEETKEIGEYSDTFDVSNLQDGLYVLVMEYNGTVKKTKLILDTD